MHYYVVANETRSKNSTVIRDALLARDAMSLLTGPLKYSARFTVQDYIMHPYQVSQSTQRDRRGREREDKHRCLNKNIGG